ncbi:MAG: AEC family transporter [Hahellaceae bacterium]|nr:AEC family transporter [Hahellaceae bacterium]MCP5169389.1 AEC family transporter [Hahellaceae bacterium]
MLAFTANITLPIFIIVFLGWYLRRIQWISADFIQTGSKLVFNLALPALLFSKIVVTDLSQVLQGDQVIFALAATLAGFVLVWVQGRKWLAQPEVRGVFVQGAFRGNMGIIGLALCANLYGDEGLAVGSILLAFLTLQYNILSVYALTAPFYSTSNTTAGLPSGALRWVNVLKDIAKNPLILMILAALTVNLTSLPVPGIVLKSGEYFSNLTLPLALLCVGGSINLKALRRSSHPALWAAAHKLILLPTLMTLAAWLYGFEGIALGTLFAMFASPTATASFVMAKAMRGDGDLAANIIALTTVLSLFSVSAGIFILKVLNVA